MTNSEVDFSKVKGSAGSTLDDISPVIADIKTGQASFTTVHSGINAIGSVQGAVGFSIISQFPTFKQPFTFISSFINSYIINPINRIANTLYSGISSLWGFINYLVQSFNYAVAQLLQRIISTAQSIANSIMGVINNVISQIVNVIQTTVNRITSWVQLQFNNFVNWVRAQVTYIYNIIVEYINRFVKEFLAIWQWLKSNVNTLITFITKYLGYVVLLFTKYLQTLFDFLTNPKKYIFIVIDDMLELLIPKVARLLELFLDKIW